MNLYLFLCSLLNSSAVTRPLVSLSLNPLLLAQAEVTTISGLKSIVGKAVAVLIILGYLAALGLLLAGITKRSEDPDAAKKMFVTAIYIAIAPTVLSLLFFLGGLGGATVKANFDD